MRKGKRPNRNAEIYRHRQWGILKFILSACKSCGKSNSLSCPLSTLPGDFEFTPKSTASVWHTISDHTCESLQRPLPSHQLLPGPEAFNNPLMKTLTIGAMWHTLIYFSCSCGHLKIIKISRNKCLNLI